MSSLDSSLDAVVVGAGTSGAASALQLARKGLRVALIDARPRDEAGPHWFNGIPDWMFQRAAIDSPKHPEDRTTGDTVHMLDPAGRRHVTIERVEMRTIDMRLLGARLRDEAERAGCMIVDRARVLGVDRASGRTRGVEIAREGKTGVMRASLFVDGSGMKGVLRTRTPTLAASCPPPREGHVCSAAHAIRRIRDVDGARAFLDRHEARSGEALTFLGVEESWSTCVVRIDLEAREVDFVTGAIAGGGRRTGRRILLDFVETAPWIGEDVIAGEGAIPLRRPYDLLGAEGVALVGDAGCMVFPAHGSGVGAGLIGARILAESVASASDPGSEASLTRYRSAFHREVGGVLAAYDVFRRFTQRATPYAFARILAHLVTPGTTHASLAQRMPVLSFDDVMTLLRATTHVPDVSLPIAAAAARMQLVRGLYAAHPPVSSRRALVAWSRLVGAAFRERPDLAA
ncbi:MAG: NAD(P)/FAD-dependent oxidoreductase [Polyangiales bacterium]